MGSLFQVIKNAITHVFQGVQGSYAFSLLGKAFIRLRTAVMNPFQRVVRRIQQLFNANIITSKLVTPINAKVRKVLNGEAKKVDGQKVQQVKSVCNFVGEIPEIAA